MVQHVEAVYENGILRPLQVLHLQESERVRLAVSPNMSDSSGDVVDQTLLEYARSRVDALEQVPTIDEVRANLSRIEGSMAELIISERGEY